MKRQLHLTADLLRAYSRRGNFHSDPEAAASLGYRRLVAQGMQAAAPAYGLLLDAWGAEFLAHGALELKFVGLVEDDDTVEADVRIADATATLTVRNVTATTTAVVGTARRSITDR